MRRSLIQAGRQYHLKADLLHHGMLNRVISEIASEMVRGYELVQDKASFEKKLSDRFKVFHMAVTRL
jgi:hypothetical protein